MNSKRIIAYTDGAARGNPGPAAIGAVIYQVVDDELHQIDTVCEAIGNTTNNVAEYQAVIAALDAAAAAGATEVELRSDSQLLVKQLNGEFRVKAKHLRPLFARAQSLLEGFETARVTHVYREQNTEADALANAALDT